MTNLEPDNLKCCYDIQTYIYNKSIVSNDHMRIEPSKEDVMSIDEDSGCRSRLVTARECPRNVCTSPPFKLHTFTTRNKNKVLLLMELQKKS